MLIISSFLRLSSHICKFIILLSNLYPRGVARIVLSILSTSTFGTMRRRWGRWLWDFHTPTFLHFNKVTSSPTYYSKTHSPLNSLILLCLSSITTGISATGFNQKIRLYVTQIRQQPTLT